MSYKVKDKTKGYNIVNGENVLNTDIVENITFRKRTNPLKKRHYDSIDLLTNHQYEL